MLWCLSNRSSPYQYGLIISCIITASIDGTIVEGPDWQLVDENVSTSKFDYEKGVINNGANNGIVTFEVPLDAPDTLFYQSSINADRFGRFLVQDIEENTSINIV